MNHIFLFRKGSVPFKTIAAILGLCLIFGAILRSQRQVPISRNAVYDLPSPTGLLSLSDHYSFPLLKGVQFHPEDPLIVEFIIDTASSDDIDQEEASRLIRYFLAGLTLSEEELWVNLSPHEEERVVSDEVGLTDLGKDMLGQDYILKQLLSSLTYPEDEIGKDYWQKTYKEVAKAVGTTNIPIDTFNKIWIVPDTATIYANRNVGFITEASLKVMLEEDYLALRNNTKAATLSTKSDSEVSDPDEKEKINSIASRALKKIVLPKITEDVNYGKNFARLRQIYHSLVLSVWFKQQFKESCYKHYIDQAKIKGIDLEDKNVKEKIFNLYVEAYKKGVYDYIKNDYDPAERKQVQRRYYSGGVGFKITPHLTVETSQTASIKPRFRGRRMRIRSRLGPLGKTLDGKDTLQQNSLSVASSSVPDNAQHPRPFGLRFGTATSKEWKDAIQRDGRWHSGIDFSRFLGPDRRLLVMGDTDHGNLGIQRGLVEHVGELKATGVTHLVLELPSDWSISHAIEDESAGWIHHRLVQLIELAQNNGIEVVFMDMPLHMRRSSWSEKEESRERGIYMGRVLARLLNDNPMAMVVAATGYSHIYEPGEISEQLNKGDISYSLVGLVSEDQPQRVPGLEEATFLSERVVQAVAELVPKGQRYGYIDVTGFNFEARHIQAIFHFRRPTPDALKAVDVSSRDLISTDRPLGLTTTKTELVPVAKGTISKPLHLDFNTEVEPHVEYWKADNERKILELVGRLSGLSYGQRIYLTALLCNYIRNTGRHSLGGSILTIGFVPEGQFFEITTVDTFHYPFNPEADYGARMQHHEVSLKRLQEEFGFEDILIKDLSSLDDIPIRLAPDLKRPTAAIDMLFLILTANKYPQRLAVVRPSFLEPPTSVAVYRGESGRSVKMAELTLDEFLLTDAEHALLETVRILRPFSGVLQTLGFYIRDKDKGMKGWFRSRRKRAINRGLKSLNAIKDTLSDYDEVRGRILAARKKLAYLDTEQIAESTRSIDKKISEIETALAEIYDFFSQHDKSSRVFSNIIEGTPMVMLRKAHYRLRQVKNARSKMKTTTHLALSDSRPKAQQVPSADIAEDLSLPDEPTLPALVQGNQRRLYFTGPIDQQALQNILEHGTYLSTSGELDIYDYSWRRPADYLFVEISDRPGLGYVLFVDFPEQLSWEDQRQQLAEDGNPTDPNYIPGRKKLSARYITGAVNQKTGETISSTASSSTPIANETKDKVGGLDFTYDRFNIQVRGQAKNFNFDTFDNLLKDIEGLSIMTINIENISVLEFREMLASDRSSF